MYNTYTRMWGEEPPRFDEGILYELPPESRFDCAVYRTGAQLNAIQENVIYDMTKRWVPAGKLETA